MLQALDPASARRWAFRALSALGEARAEVDALNVFPVPDGDTGTNLYLTFEAAVASAASVAADAPVAVVADAFARGALLGARGNSGVILAQLLRGWADTLAEHGVLDADAAVEGFRRADSQAWDAVEAPVEGTILSVSRAAARAASAAAGAHDDPDGRLAAVVAAAADAARRALEDTRDQLPVLTAAGVVDAGGRGLVVLIDSVARLVTGGSRSRPARGHREPSADRAEPPSDRRAERAGEAARPGHPPPGRSAPSPGYEVMYLLDAEDAAVEQLRARLAPLGDSLVVVGGGGLWNVHVHVNDAGAAIEAGVALGRPHRIRVTHLADPWHGHWQERRRTETGAGLVAGAAGDGLAELFDDAGAVVVRTGTGPPPSTAVLMAAIRETAAACVVVLPNDEATLGAAQAAATVARTEGLRVSVLPTRAQVQGLAAAAVHIPSRAFDDDVVAMSAAAGAARDGAVTVALRHALTTAGECRPGDVLGVVDGDFAVVGTDLLAVATEVVHRLLSGGGELVTLVTGAGADPGLAAAVAAGVRREHREVEVAVLDGGQDRYPLLVGVE